MLEKTAIYIRVSTEEQARDGFSIHAQMDKLTKYAEVNDWKIVDYYIGNVRYGLRKKNKFEVPGKDIVSIVDREVFFKVQKKFDRKRSK